MLLIVAAISFLYSCHNGTHTGELSLKVCETYMAHVVPVIHNNIVPYIYAADESTGFSKSVVNPIRQHSAKLDEKWKISYKLDKWSTAMAVWTATHGHKLATAAHQKSAYYAAVVRAHFGNSVAPWTEYYVSLFLYHAKQHSSDAFTTAKYHSLLTYRSAKRHLSRAWIAYLAPRIDQFSAAVAANEYVQACWQNPYVVGAVAWSQKLRKFLGNGSASVAAKMQTRLDFLRDEYAGVVKFNALKQKFTGNAHEVANELKRILSDVKNSKNKNVVEDVEEAKQSAEDIAVNVKAKADAVADILRDVASETAEDVKDVAKNIGGKLSGNESEEEHSAEKQEEDFENLSDDTLVDDELDEEVEIVTSTLTRTTTVRASEDSLASASAKDVKESGADLIDAQFESEISYWKRKVDSTLELATTNLKDDMLEFLEAELSELKESISSVFVKLQSDNYQRYKVMAELIASIDKDLEFIRTENQIIEEPEVDRQIMRDKIKEAYNVTEETMKTVEYKLNSAHLKIMEKYFEVAQLTVDVLESFADSTILDFSNRLTALIDFWLVDPSFSDKLSWSSWKKFHAVKDLIFDIRDKIYDEAHEFRQKPRGTQIPLGLDTWSEYLDNINFHIKYLLQDNDEYLKLVRAKANLAYQMREGLTRQLKAAEEEAAKVPEVNDNDIALEDPLSIENLNVSESIISALPEVVEEEDPEASPEIHTEVEESPAQFMDALEEQPLPEQVEEIEIDPEFVPESPQVLGEAEQVPLMVEPTVETQDSSNDLDSETSASVEVAQPISED